MKAPMTLQDSPAPLKSKSMRRPVPPPFGDEPTRQVDDDILAALRALPGGSDSPPKPPPKAAFGEEPTRMANIDPRAYDETGVEERTDRKPILTTPTPTPRPMGEFDDNSEEATRLSSLEGISAMERARQHGVVGADERTRAVNIRNDPSISDIDWDLD